MNLTSRIFSSPIGDITLVADDSALRVLAWGGHLERVIAGLGPLRHDAENPVLDRACAQLTRYFAGTLTAFDLPVQPMGTEFQRRVWGELSRIPYGTTLSYQGLARRLGRPGASRAVGGANGKNPIGIIIPCHRVIGASGRLTGYAGGLDAKRYLLELEGAAAIRPAA